MGLAPCKEMDANNYKERAHSNMLDQAVKRVIAIGIGALYTLASLATQLTKR